MELTEQQEAILNSTSKKVVVSASAGSGKTFVLIEKLISLIRDKKVPVSRLLVLTFTKAAAKEMQSRLYLSMLEQTPSPFIVEQIDDISISDISTIDSFCEKIIKRNISKLDIDEGFVILDEHASQVLKRRAFQSMFDFFSANREEFDTVYFAFKRNKERLEECIFEMQSYFDSLAQQEETKNAFLQEYETYYRKSCDYLMQQVEGKIVSAKMLLAKAQTFVDIPEKAMSFAVDLDKELASLSFADKDFFQVCDQINMLSLADLPRHKCDKDFKKSIARAKEYVKDAIEICQHYKGITPKEIEEFEMGRLAKALLRMYDFYQKKYNQLKKNRSALDFADIERYAKLLLEDEEIKKGLQERYDYIFIDEYQDTNRLQESILKPIAEGGFFTAVGDIKQGIYGFRNASKEIMLQDIADFTAAEDGEALYLTGNFRTEESILSFVNDIFCQIMTKKSAGIEYADKSKLVGLKTFQKGALPPVRVDVVDSEKAKEDKIVRCGVYSVRDDEASQEEKYKKEIATIEARIDEVLGSQIYDVKKEVWRNATQSDIALLFRNRSALMQECVKHLQAKGYSVEADIKNSLLEDGQIKLICALLKLSLCLEDDISLAAVMCSPFGEFSLNDLSALRLANPDKQFYEIVLASEDEKIVCFLQRIKEFAFDCQVHGVIKALQKLFNETYYYDYIKSLADAGEKMAHINEFFKLIRACDYDLKPMAIISALEQNSKQKATADGNVDAITITTIHATKGLEYPVVILCGCGESLSKVYNKNYMLSTTFGLGTYVYDFASDKVFTSPAFLAGKLKRAKEEFEGELMVFYVALTRAQNHLYIVGSGKEKDFSFDEIEKQNNYLKLIFYALGENFLTQLFSQGQIASENRRYEIVQDILEEEGQEIKNIQKNNNLQKFAEKIKEYQEFVCKNQKNCKLNFKNSVTGVLKLNEDDIFVKEFNIAEENTNKIKNAIDSGNAYHEALKIIDFRKINSFENMEEELEKIKPQIKEEYFSLINKKILYNNIITINKLIKNQTLFKEHEFLMKCPLSDIGLEGEDEVIVQGIVDFFAIGEENVLIDYKYTSTKNEEVIKERYEKQLQLYTLAIEKAFGVKVDKRYLLSLKEAKLIEI